MEIRYCRKFLRDFKKLEREIQDCVGERIKIFRQNAFDSRLKTHKLHGRLEGFWAFWVDRKNRIIFEFSENTVVFFYSVGDHDIYE